MPPALLGQPSIRPLCLPLGQGQAPGEPTQALRAGHGSLPTTAPGGQAGVAFPTVLGPTQAQRHGRCTRVHTPAHAHTCASCSAHTHTHTLTRVGKHAEAPPCRPGSLSSHPRRPQDTVGGCSLRHQNCSRTCTRLRGPIPGAALSSQPGLGLAVRWRTPPPPRAQPPVSPNLLPRPLAACGPQGLRICRGGPAPGGASFPGCHGPGGQGGTKQSVLLL